jgi:hypothetical protein
MQDQKTASAVGCFQPKTSAGAHANTEVNHPETDLNGCSGKAAKHTRPWNPREQVQSGGDMRDALE